MTKSKINWYKWIGAAIVVAALMFWSRSCGIKSVIKESRIDTVVSVDTSKEWYPFPIPYEVLKHTEGEPYPVIKWKHDTLPGITVTVTEKVDTPAILSSHFEKRFYKTITQLKNGTVISEDTVWQNIITGKGVRALIFDTSINRNTTIFPPQKTVLLFSLSMMGKQTDPFHGAGAGFGLKDKKDRVYSFEVKTIRDQGTYGELRLQLPVRNPFKKRK